MQRMSKTRSMAFLVHCSSCYLCNSFIFGTVRTSFQENIQQAVDDMTTALKVGFFIGIVESFYKKYQFIFTGKNT